MCDFYIGPQKHRIELVIVQSSRYSIIIYVCPVLIN